MRFLKFAHVVKAHGYTHVAASGLPSGGAVN